MSDVVLPRPRLVLTGLLAAAFLSSSLAAQGPCEPERISLAPGGQQLNGYSLNGQISEDARYVLFSSTATNLHPGKTEPFVSDVFRLDRTNGDVELVSVGLDGLAAGGAVGDFTRDGRWALFSSFSDDLVPGTVPNGFADVFLKDLTTGEVFLLSQPSPTEAGNGQTFTMEISEDGRFVAFGSEASNLVPGDTNGHKDVFLHDRQLGTTTRVNLGPGGVEANFMSQHVAISGDGGTVLWSSGASNLVPGDTNGVLDVFAYDVASGTVERVNLAADGAQLVAHSYQPSPSDDGRFIGFTTTSSGVVPQDNDGAFDVFVRDRELATTTWISFGLVGTTFLPGKPILSPDGRFVAFSYTPPGGAPGSRQSYLHDRLNGNTGLMSLNPVTGMPGNGSSWASSITPDGQVVVFDGFASDLVPGDTNDERDVFLRECGVEPTANYCTAKVNSLGCAGTITTAGFPSVNAPAGFELAAVEIRNNVTGLLFYGKSGAAATPFQGGLLCVEPPTLRTPGQVSAGSSPPTQDCSGTFSIDFNAYIAGGSDASLVAGVQVWAQYWSRDPGFAPPNNTHLTDGARFTIGL